MVIYDHIPSIYDHRLKFLYTAIYAPLFIDLRSICDEQTSILPFRAFRYKDIGYSNPISSNTNPIRFCSVHFHPSHYIIRRSYYITARIQFTFVHIDQNIGLASLNLCKSRPVTRREETKNLGQNSDALKVQINCIYTHVHTRMSSRTKVRAARALSLLCDVNHICASESLFRSRASSSSLVARAQGFNASRGYSDWRFKCECLLPFVSEEGKGISC